MKIEKVKSREYKNTSYYKYRVIIPKELLEKSGLKPGDELVGESPKRGEILLRKGK